MKPFSLDRFLSVSVKKILLSSFLIVSMFFSCSIAWGADWGKYSLSDSGLFFYDAKGITHPSKDIVRVWEKLVYTEKKIREIIEKFGREYENFHHAIMLNEINCKDKTYRQIQVTHYTEGGKVIWSGDFYDARWDFIPPESVVEALSKIICKYRL